jgi:hypothetical protein
MSIPSVRETAIAPAAASLVAPSRTSAPPPAAPHGPSPFARLLHGLGSEVQRGEALVKRASDGAGASTLDAGQLIALQAGVYRYSEAIDLAARLIDHATTGLKTVLQGQ